MSIVLNPQVFKAMSALTNAKRNQERRPERRSSEDNLQLKRQKCIALKTVDYDDLSDSVKSGVELNITKIEPAKPVVTTKVEEPLPDWTNFKSLLLREGAFNLFNTHADHMESDENSE